jgi:hypothetical protein
MLWSVVVYLHHGYNPYFQPWKLSQAVLEISILVLITPNCFISVGLFGCYLMIYSNNLVDYIGCLLYKKHKLMLDQLINSCWQFSGRWMDGLLFRKYQMGGWLNSDTVVFLRLPFLWWFCNSGNNYIQTLSMNVRCRLFLTCCFNICGNKHYLHCFQQHYLMILISQW